MEKNDFPINVLEKTKLLSKGNIKTSPNHTNQISDSDYEASMTRHKQELLEKP